VGEAGSARRTAEHHQSDDGEPRGERDEGGKRPIV
jgi:hypothetical protein